MITPAQANILTAEAGVAIASVQPASVLMTTPVNVRTFG